MEAKLEAEAQAANAEFNDLQVELVPSNSDSHRLQVFQRMKRLDDIRHDCLRKLRELRFSGHKR